MDDLVTYEVACFCPTCNEHFNAKVTVPARYESVLIRFCPLCGVKDPCNLHTWQVLADFLK